MTRTSIPVPRETVLVLAFGAQYGRLIARQVDGAWRRPASGRRHEPRGLGTQLPAGSEALASAPTAQIAAMGVPTAGCTACSSTPKWTTAPSGITFSGTS